MSDRTKDYEHDRRRYLPSPLMHGLKIVFDRSPNDGAAFLYRCYEEAGHGHSWPDVRLCGLEEYRRRSCIECRGTGFADEGRPCEHP